MRSMTFFMAFVVFNINFFAQGDSIKRIAYTPDFKFIEGIYLNFEQVKNNHPIIKSRIVTNIDYNDNQFFDVLLSNPVITF